MTGPWFVQCQRHGCDRIKAVESRCQQLRQRYCSKSCASKVSTARNPQSRKTLGALGGKAGAVMRRARMMARVVTLTPVEAYRKGRQEGWHAGYLAAVKRMAVGRAA